MILILINQKAKDTKMTKTLTKKTILNGRKIMKTMKMMNRRHND